MFSSGGARNRRRPGYVLLETVIATGILIVGLAVLGGMVQDSYSAVRKMEIKVQARWLAEQFLAELDTGLILIDSIDEIQEESFGPRHPKWAWRLTIHETASEELFVLEVEVLYDPLRDDDRQEFDFEEKPTVYTLHAMRAVPQQVDLGTAFGLREEEIEELTEKLSGLGIEGLDPAAFDPSILGKMDFEELVEVLPTLLDAFGIDYSALLAQLPAEVRAGLEEAGLSALGSEEGDGGGSDASGSWGQGP